MCRRFWIIAAILAWSLSASSQEAQPLTGQFTHWTVEDGLCSGEVRSLVEDPRGYIWIGNNGGLVKFDGQRMQQFYPGDGPKNVPDGRINGLLVVDTLLYIATEGGFAVMDLNRETIEELPNVNPDGTRYQRAECVTSMRDGRLLLCYEKLTPSLGGIGLFDPQTRTYENFLGQADYNAGGMHAIEDPSEDGVVWLGGWDYVTRLDTRTGEHQKLNPPGLSGGRFQYHDLEVLNDSTLLVPRLSSGIFTLNTRSLEWELVSPKCVAIGLEPLGDGKYILNTNNSGIGIFDLKTQSIAYYPIEPGSRYALPEDDSDVALYDQMGRIWLGHDAGLSLLDPFLQQFQTTTFEPTRSKLTDFRLGQVVAHPTEPRLALGTPYQDGLYIVDSETLEVEAHYKTYPSGKRAGDPICAFYLHFLTPDTLVWANWQGLFAMHWPTRKIWQMLEHDDPRFGGNCGMQMNTLPSGRLILEGNLGRFFIFDPKTDSVKEYKTPGWDSSRVTNYNRGFDRDVHGRVWMASNYSAGCYDEATDAYIPLENFIPGFEYNKEWRALDFAALGDSLVYMAVQVEGLVELNVKAGTKRVIDAGENNQAWPYRVMTDSQGRIWSATSLGMMRYDSKTDRTSWFDANSGLPLSELTRAFLCESPRGELFLASQKYLVRMDINALQTNTELPRIAIEALRVNGEVFGGDIIPSSIESLTLQPGQDQLSFDMAALAFTQPDQVTYAYRLQGADEEWNETGKNGYGNYTNLDAGDYTLQLRASNSEGLWGPTVELPVSVKPMYYQTWWFIALMIALGAAIVWLIAQARNRRIREKQRIQAEFEKKIAEVEMGALRAQMNPHFLFNCLNSIKYFIIQNRVEEAADYLTKFARLIRLILNNSKTELVPLGAELDALDLYVQMERLRFQDQFSYDISVGEGVDRDSVSVPPLLIQPFVENAIWHGLMHRESPGHLSIDVVRTGEMLTCYVQDDGIGREKASELRSKQSVKRKSLGMDITKDRVETINQLYNSSARIAVEDLYENEAPAGTRVVIEIPLQ